MDTVTPAKAGVQSTMKHWIPAYAGMTAFGYESSLHP
jgi:hypothetical protein